MTLQSYLWNDHELFDWLCPVKDPDRICSAPEGSAICCSAFVYKMLGTMTELAAICGHEEDIPEYKEAREKIFEAFNSKFYNEAEAVYETGYWSDHYRSWKDHYRQCNNLVPLAVGLVPEEQRSAVVKKLAEKIRENGDHLDTGSVGTMFLLPVLADNGYEELAMSLLQQKTYPSWGYWLESGSDTCWEGWEDTSRSRDHYFFGSFVEFFYSHLAGICEMKNGFETAVIRPVFPKGLDSVDCTLNTVRGDLTVCWKKQDGKTAVSITVSDGTSAKIVLPGTEETVSGGTFQYII